MNDNPKSTLRAKLELLEEDIHRSWLKDLDKTQEMTELTNLLTQMANRETLESFFENQNDFDYFIKKFSKETLTNILRQNCVVGNSGDEIALKLLLAYVTLWLKFYHKPQYAPLWDSVREIFEPSKKFFRDIYLGNMNIKVVNTKKHINADRFNETLPKNPDKFKEFSPGDQVDLLIDNKKSRSNIDKIAWIKGTVDKVEGDRYIVLVAEDGLYYQVLKGSLSIIPVGTMTKDYEWRTSLKQWDIVDGFDRGKWYPATVVYSKQEQFNGHIKCTYRIGFRLYPETFDDWKKYAHHWHDQTFHVDNGGRKYIGDSEAMDEILHHYSKRIQKFNSIIALDVPLSSISEALDQFIVDDFYLFEQSGKKNYIIGKGSHFCYYFALLLKEFAEGGGYEKMMNMLSEKPNPDALYMIFHILSNSFSYLHKDFAISIVDDITKSAVDYIKDISTLDLRSMKRDTFELLTKVLTLFQNTKQVPDTQLIEEFFINTSFRMIKTSIFDKRFHAIKTLVDYIRTHKQDHLKTQNILKMIEENNVIYEIFGPNTHTQLISKGKELIEFMLTEDKLSEKEIELIWSGTQKGDLERKLMILKMLFDVSKDLQMKHKKILLESIYSNISDDLLQEEIDLICELSTSTVDDDDIEKCITFFTKCLLNSQSLEGNKINSLIKKIFDIIKVHVKFRQRVIGMCLDCLEMNKNTILALKMLTVFLNETNMNMNMNMNMNKSKTNITSYFSEAPISLPAETSEEDPILNSLFTDNSLINLFCKNFRIYKALALEYLGTNGWSLGTSQGENVKVDNFTHNQHIKARVEFIQMIQSHTLFKKAENNFDFVLFTYEMLVENPICERDKPRFFRYIQRTLEKSTDKSIEAKVLKLFEEKICPDLKSCRELSIEAFESFFTVFLTINAQNHNLYHFISQASKNNKRIIKVLIDPEKLIGFNILWTIVFESLSKEIMINGIENIHTIYANSKVRIRETGTGTVIQKDTEITYSDILLRKCLGMIKDLIESSTIDIEEKWNKIKKCLRFLTLIIEESEKKGTGRIKSHLGLLKRKILTLKIYSLITGKSGEFNIRVYGNTTMFELKEIIAKKIDLCVDFLRILVKNEDIAANDNGKTVLEMNISDHEEIKIMLNNMSTTLPQAEFFKNGHVNPELEKIFNIWYSKYSTDDKMTREDLSNFITAVTNHKETVSATDSRVTELFTVYDKENLGYFSRTDFVGFYIESARTKEKVVWENLHSMGIRNDLKNFNEHLERASIDKTKLPRYQLAHNEEYFNILFSLQDLHEFIAKDSFQFICSIATNPKIFKELLDNSAQNVSECWNIYKLIYSLQIIESFIEDIEIDCENIDSFVTEETILGDEGVSLESLKKRKIEWTLKFIRSGAFKQLIDILNMRFTTTEEMGIMDKICIELLIKIIKIFFNSALNKFEFYRQFSSKKPKAKPSLLPVTDEERSRTNDQKNEANENIKTIDTNILTSLFEGELGNTILSAIDYSYLASNLLNLLACLGNSTNLSQEDLNLIENAFEFLLGVIAFSPETAQTSNLIQGNSNFQQIFRFGLFNNQLSIREKFGDLLIKFSKICEHLQKFNILIVLFCDCINIFSTLYLDNLLVKNSHSFFEFFSFLFEINFASQSSPVELIGKNINIKEFILKISEEIANDLSDLEEQECDNDNNNNNNDNVPRSQLPNELFIGYLKIITKVVDSSNEIKKELNEKFSLIQLILTRVLFVQNSKEMREKLMKTEYISPDKFNDKNRKSSNILVREACYDFILSMLKTSIENFEIFFSLNLFEGEREIEKEKEDVKSSSSSALGQNKSTQNMTNAMRSYYQSTYGKKEGHVGLRNLGCICYMNSIMQQMFMVPTFRYAILQANDKKDPVLANPDLIDDNVLHQLQRMYTFLELSSREDFSPSAFCFSFKDLDGQSTNTRIQQDSQEFLNSFCDKIENSLKSTCFKYIINSVFVGRTCSQVICDACGTVSNRFEDFYNLTLEVQNIKTLSDSLEKFISPEKIDEFLCETCQKKVTITKRTSLAELPNVLIIHLKRFFMNYEIERTEKINSRLEFPKNLNLKRYCIEELMKNQTGNVYETDEIYLKQNEYYDYHLVGVNVHVGSADGGHYFSFINTERQGKQNELMIDPGMGNQSAFWLDFNDSSVSKFNIAKLDEECYGGSLLNAEDTSIGNWNSGRTWENNQSAYLLIYERKKKTPIKILVNEPEGDYALNAISFKAEEAVQIKKQYDISRLVANEGNDIEGNKVINLNETYFYDSAKNEYFQLKNFYGLECLIPRMYYLEVNEDNGMFQKQQNILDEHFNKFFESAIILLEEAICDSKNIKPETSVSICRALIHFIMKTINTREKPQVQVLTATITKLITLMEVNPECVRIVLEYITNNPRMAITGTLINEEALQVQAYSKLFAFIIQNGCNSSNVICREMALRLCDNIFHLFPKIGYRFVNKIYPLYSIFGIMLEIDEFFYEYFYQRRVFSVFVTYLIGKDSPCYPLYSIRDYWDATRCLSIQKCEDLVNVMHTLLKRSVQYYTSKNISTHNNLSNCKLFSLTDDDIKCLKSPTFFKLIATCNQDMLSDLYLLFMPSDKDITLKGCDEISRIIDETPLLDYDNLIKLANSLVMPVVNIKDDFRLERYQLLIGYPRVIVDHPNHRSNWPLFGYNRLSSNQSKWLKYVGKNYLRPNGCLLGKLSSVKSNTKVALEIFYTMLNHSKENPTLMKYLWDMPAEEPMYKSFMDWGIELTREYTHTSVLQVNDFETRLNSLLPIIQNTLENAGSSTNKIRGYRGFAKGYLPGKIKREEIRHICKGEGLHLLRIEYYTTVITTDHDIDYSESASYYDGTNSSTNTGPCSLDDKTNSLKTDKGIYVIDIKDRNPNEQEFFKSIIPKFEQYKKVIVQQDTAANDIQNPMPTLIRYVIMNTNHYEGLITMKVARPESSKCLDINEFIPSIIVETVSEFGIQNYLVMNKVDPEKDWSVDVQGIAINIHIEWNRFGTLDFSKGN